MILLTIFLVILGVLAAGVGGHYLGVLLGRSAMIVDQVDRDEREAILLRARHAEEWSRMHPARAETGPSGMTGATGPRREGRTSMEPFSGPTGPPRAL